VNAVFVGAVARFHHRGRCAIRSTRALNHELDLRIAFLFVNVLLNHGKRCVQRTGDLLQVGIRGRITLDTAEGAGFALHHGSTILIHQLERHDREVVGCLQRTRQEIGDGLAHKSRSILDVNYIPAAFEMLRIRIARHL
jgi:hypothetical protein